MPSDFLEYIFVRIASMFIYGLFFLLASAVSQVSIKGKEFTYMTHSQILGKVESGGGPIFKVVLEC